MRMNQTLELYRNNNQVIIDAFDRIVVRVFMEKQKYNHKSFVICGCTPGAGTTSTSVELAISLAVSGWKTVLVDADLRKEHKYKRLNQKVKVGLSDYIVDSNLTESVCYPTNWPGLDYIACGKAIDETPVKMLCSSRMGTLIEELYRDYDFIIFDVSSLSSAVDAKILASKVDCVMLVAEAEKTGFANLSDAKEQLEEAGANIVGVIANKVSLEEYKRVVRDYNYFREKEFIGENQFFKEEAKREPKSAGSGLVSFLRKTMGCFLLAGLLLLGAGGLEAYAAPDVQNMSVNMAPDVRSMPADMAPDVYNIPAAVNVAATDAAADTIAQANSPMPFVMVTGYSITEGAVVQGGNFTLDLEFCNESRYAAAWQNYISVYLHTDGMALQPGETNQRYIEAIEPGGVGHVQFKLTVGEEVESKNAMIEVQFAYVNEAGSPGTNATMISPEIQESCKLELVSLKVSDMATVDSRSLFNIRYANTGKTDIRKITLKIDGNIENAGKERQLEIPEVGRQKNLDDYVVFTETGSQRLTVDISYEDEAGNVYQLEPQKVSVLVKEKAKTAQNQEQTEKTSGGPGEKLKTVADSLKIKFGAGPVQIDGNKQNQDESTDSGIFAAVVAAAVIVCLILVLLIVKKRPGRKKKSRSGGFCLISLRSGRKHKQKGGKEE